MSEEQQTQQQQQQRQQLHQPPPPQQQKLNNGEDAPAASTPTPPRKMSIHELRNQDFVSRLLAATPPYLYSAPVGPNNFFFSDMLRSLVQAKNRENARNLQLQQQTVLARRPRKRSWSHHHRPLYDHHLDERKEVESKQSPISNSNCHASSARTATSAPVPGCKLLTEKPLELTNKRFLQVPLKYNKVELVKDEEKIVKSTEIKTGKDAAYDYVHNVAPGNTTLGGGAVDSMLQNTPAVASLPPQDLVLPPPPPIWYPPLYSPYGIDPLHFFIDLRVSGGHVYDRKKETVSPLGSAENNTSTSVDFEKPGITEAVSPLNKYRHGSAFTVPVPRSNELAKAAAAAAAGNAINLSANKFENYTKYYDLGESKENRPGAKNNANYVLQHLPRLYTQITARDLISAAASSSEFGSNFGNDSKSEPDCDAESIDGQGSSDNCEGRMTPLERDIDVEMIESTKRRVDGGESRHCSSPDDAFVTQID